MSSLLRMFEYRLFSLLNPFHLVEVMFRKRKITDFHNNFIVIQIFYRKIKIEIYEYNILPVFWVVISTAIIVITITMKIRPLNSLTLANIVGDLLRGTPSSPR